MDRLSTPLLALFTSLSANAADVAEQPQIAGHFGSPSKIGFAAGTGSFPAL